MNGVIQEAKYEDLRVILELQKKAFERVAIKTNNPNIAPMTQTQKQIEEEFKKGLFLKYEDNGKIVGSVRAYVTSEGACHIGRLITESDYQNQGIGTALMKEIEKRLCDSQYFEIFTGEDFPNVINLYKKIGYRVTHTESMDSVPMVFMRKDN